MTKTNVRQLTYLTISAIKPDPRNPRRHSPAQIEAIARSLDAFGFNAPILIDKNAKVLAGHGRLEAAKLRGLTEVPVICLEHLTDTQARAYRPSRAARSIRFSPTRSMSATSVTKRNATKANTRRSSSGHFGSQSNRSSKTRTMVARERKRKRRRARWRVSYSTRPENASRRAIP